jgi:hypothetical protein
MAEFETQQRMAGVSRPREKPMLKNWPMNRKA